MSDTDETSDDVSRRWLIRILIGLGIGLPLLIEGVTFLGLIKSRLFGGDDEAPTATTTSTPRPGVGVGDELLPATAPSDTLSDAVVRTTGAGSGWTFELTISVENTTDAPYELRLGTLTTAEGTRVESTASTGQIPPGASETMADSYAIPGGETPETLSLTAVAYPASGAEVTARTVRFADIPVLG
ncbi:MAG: hypothetical protein ABEK02_06015 [Haloquadratum sp.]